MTKLQESTAPAGSRNPSHLFGGVDSISSLPDENLHHILSFVPTNLAITTSVLSKRWRHIWCETPYLSFACPKASVESISKTLAAHSAAKIMRFHLHVNSETCEASEMSQYVGSLIKFAISRNVETLSLVFDTYYALPDLIFRNSSLKNLIVNSFSYRKFTVSWTDHYGICL